MFLERNPVVIGAVAVALLAGLTVAALTVQRRDLGGGYGITAEFDTANGLRVGDVVTVAGYRVGEVTDLRIADQHVQADLVIQGVELPVQTRAAIRPQTLVGKRAVELETGADFSRLLVDGDVIPLGQTSVASDVPTFTDEAQALLSEVDADALNTFVRSLAALTAGQREEVAQLIDGGTRLTRVVNDQEQEVRRLLVALIEVGRTVNSRDEELVAVIDGFNVVLDRVAARRDDLRRLFAETSGTSATAADIVAAHRAELDAILDELHADARILSRHQLDIAEALAYAPDSIGGFASISFAGDVRVPWGHILVQSLGPAGVDVILGCGGLLDRQLDQVLGPDPRSCELQEDETFPDDVGGSEPGQGVGGDPPRPQQAAAVDVLARRLLVGEGDS